MPYDCQLARLVQGDVLTDTLSCGLANDSHLSLDTEADGGGVLKRKQGSIENI